MELCSPKVSHGKTLEMLFFCWEKVYDFQMPCVKMLGGHQDLFQEGTVLG